MWLCIHREQKWGLNTYLYAPKDDYKHRMYWRDLYTAEEAGEFQTVVIKNLIYLPVKEATMGITFSKLVDVGHHYFWELLAVDLVIYIFTHSVTWGTFLLLKIKACATSVFICIETGAEKCIENAPTHCQHWMFKRAAQ